MCTNKITIYNYVLLGRIILVLLFSVDFKRNIRELRGNISRYYPGGDDPADP